MGWEKYAAVLTRTTSEFTTKWSCRKGDYLLWFRRKLMAPANDEPQILDLWSTLNGTSVIMTNRWQDFPPWFDLHPTEVTSRLMGWMKSRIERRDYPEEPIDGPNIWRAKGGDRIVWVGPPRVDQTCVDGVLGILDCRAAVAVLGDHPDGLLAFMEFQQSQSGVALGSAGLRAERSLGMPHVFDTDWQLG